MSQTKTTLLRAADRHRLTIDRSLIDPDRPQLIDHQDQSTSDRFLKSPPEQMKTHLLLIRSIVESCLENQCSSACSATTFREANSFSGETNLWRAGAANSVVPLSNFGPSITHAQTHSVYKKTHCPPAVFTDTHTSQLRDFHATKSSFPPPVPLASTFTKPALYRRNLILSREPEFSLQSTFAPICPNLIQATNTSVYKKTHWSDCVCPLPYGNVSQHSRDLSPAHSPSPIAPSSPDGINPKHTRRSKQPKRVRPTYHLPLTTFH
jgi:hypothetical protein